MQFNTEPRIKRAFDHALAVHFENARRGKAAHQCLPYFRRIGPGLGGEHQCLAHRFNIQRDDDLVAHFAGLPVADTAHQRDVLAHQCKQRLGAFKRRLVAADHDGQRGVLGTRFGASDWCVQEVRAACRKRLADFDAGIRRDGAAIRNHGALADGVDQAVGAEANFFHHGGVADAQEDEIGAFRRFPRGGAHCALAFFRQCFGC